MMERVIQVEWPQKYSGSYLRTYKRASELSKKNIRCFPECQSDGHTNTGFCGQPILCTITFKQPIEEDTALYFWGKFAEHHADPEFTPGSVVQLSKMRQGERTKDSPMKPFIVGRVKQVLSPTTVQVIFNEVMLGYHYQWLSSKMTCNMMHSFKIYCFSRKGGKKTVEEGSEKDIVLQTVGYSSSPAFSLYTRHRFQGKKIDRGEDSRSAGSPSADSLSPRSVSSGNGAVRMSVKTDNSFVMQSKQMPFNFPQVASSFEKFDRSFASEDRGIAGGVEPPSPKEKRRLGELYFGSDSMGSNRAYPNDRQESFKMQRFIPENRTLDRLVRFIFRFGSKPDPAVLDTRDLTAPEEEINRDLDLVLNLIADRTGWDDLDATSNGDLYTKVEESFESSFTQFLRDSPVPHLGEDQHLRDESASQNETTTELFGSADTSSIPSNHRDSHHLEAHQQPQRASSPSDTFTTGCLPKCSYADNYGLDSLRSVIMKFHEPAEEKEALANSVLAALRHIADFVMTQMLISETTDFFSKMVKRWSTQAGLNELRKRIEWERNFQFEWNQSHEDESFDHERLDALTELSIYAEVRHGFRILMTRCLTATGHSVQELEMAMELAAKHGVLLLDPFYPPSIMAAKYLHLQLYGTTRGMEKQDYGCHSQQFVDVRQQRTYAKDLLIARRLIFRNIVLDRIQGERQLAQWINRAAKPPIPPQYNMNGTWERIKLTKKEGSLLGMQEAIGSFASEVPYGSFFNELFESLWSKLTIYIDSAVFTCQGRKVLLAHPKTIVRLGAEPQKVQQPMPLPVDSVAAVGTKRDLAGWLHMNEKGHYGVMTVISTIAVQESTASLLRTAKARLRSPETVFDSVEQRKVTEWLAGIDIRDDDEDNTSVLRIHHFYHLVDENLHLNGVVRLYIRKNEAPPLLDPLAATTTDPRCYKLVDETGVYNLVHP